VRRGPLGGLLAALLCLPLAASAERPLGPFTAGDFPVRPGMRTVCLASHSPGLQAKACFDTHPDPKEVVADKDYVVWRFLARGRADGEGRLGRLEVRMSSPVGELVEWDPGSDSFPRRPEVGQAMLYIDELNKDPGQRFRVLPGRVSPSIGDTRYGVAWLDTRKGLPCCEPAEVGGVAEWSIPQGAAMRATLTLEVRGR
jgi:hypothetical protein